MDITAARKIALDYITEKSRHAGYEFVICDSETRKLDYGWLFFYNSKKFIETDDFRYALAGNAPFLVEGRSGRIVNFGTAKPINEYLQEFEENLRKTSQ